MSGALNRLIERVSRGERNEGREEVSALTRARASDAPGARYHVRTGTTKPASRAIRAAASLGGLTGVSNLADRPVAACPPTLTTVRSVS